MFLRLKPLLTSSSHEAKGPCIWGLSWGLRRRWPGWTDRAMAADQVFQAESLVFQKPRVSKPVFPVKTFVFLRDLDHTFVHVIKVFYFELLLDLLFSSYFAFAFASSFLQKQASLRGRASLSATMQWQIKLVITWLHLIALCGANFTASWTKYASAGSGNRTVLRGWVVDAADNIYVNGHATGPFEGQIALLDFAIFCQRCFFSNDLGPWVKTDQTGGAFLGMIMARLIWYLIRPVVYVEGFLCVIRANFWPPKRPRIGVLLGFLVFFAGASARIGMQDAVLAKFNSAGSLLWSVQFGTSENDGSEAVAEDTDGIYVVGYCTGAMDGQNAIGLADAFVKKFSTSGIAVWTVQFGSTHDDWVRAVEVDSSGNVVVGGITYGSYVNDSHAGSADAFVAKFNSAGTLQWSQQRGTSSSDLCWALALGDSDEIYLTGDSDGDLDNQTNAGSLDMFLMKFSASGEWQWTVTKGGPHRDRGRAITFVSGSIWVLVNTYSNLFGTSLSNSEYDVALIKYDPSGTELLGTQTGTVNGGHLYSYDLKADASGNMYAAGRTTGSLSDEYQFSGGTNDGFLMKFDSSGVRQQVAQIGCGGSTLAWVVHPSSNGEVLVGGWTDCNLTSDGPQDTQRDMFLMSYMDASVTTATTTTLGSGMSGATMFAFAGVFVTALLQLWGSKFDKGPGMLFGHLIQHNDSILGRFSACVCCPVLKG